MNPKTTHNDWHPGETEEWIEETIARIRASIAEAAPEPPPRPRAVWEWYFDNRPMTDEEYDGAIRRAAKRGHITVDEPIGRGAPVTLTVVQGGKGQTRPHLRTGTCPNCGGMFTATTAQRVYCTPDCGTKARRKARAS